MYALTTDHQSPSAPGGFVAAVGLVAAAVGLAVVSLSGYVGSALIGVALAGAGIAAAIDARTGRIPDRLVAVAVAPAGLLMIVETVAGYGPEAAASIALGAVALAGPMFVLHLLSPAALGFGDVKLGAALGATLGLVDPRLGLVALCVASGATALVGLVTRRASLPLGPGLVLGATVALAAAGQLGGAPLPWR